MHTQTRILHCFKRSLPTYDKHATVQHHMATTLLSLLPAKQYNTVFEAGCGTCYLTRLFVSRFHCRTYTANDLVPECAAHLTRILPNAHFYEGNIDEVAQALQKAQTPSLDLIISNACLQWSCQLTQTLQALQNCLLPTGILAFSIFGPDNLQEIRTLFGVSLPTPSLAEVCAMLPSGVFLHQYEEHCTLKFPTLLAALRHMQYTGVNGLGGSAISQTRLRILEERFNKEFANTITYHPLYCVWQR